MKIITRILFTLSSISLISSQTAEELKRFMDTYDKIKVNQDSTIPYSVKTELEVESLPFNNGTRYQIDTFDMNELLDNLRDNVYPILSGENKA